MWGPGADRIRQDTQRGAAEIGVGPCGLKMLRSGARLLARAALPPTLRRTDAVRHFHASAASLFRASSVACARAPPRPDAPTQLILRALAAEGQMTTTQLWEKLESTGQYPSKNIMKKSLDFLRRHERIEVRPQTEGQKQLLKAPFLYTLGAKPRITPLEEDAASAATPPQASASA